jgi:ankyrin repeat protein
MCEAVKTIPASDTTLPMNVGIERFMELVRGNQTDQLNELMRNGFDLRQTDSESWNCLHWATEMGHQKLVLMFLDQDPLLLNMKTKEGLSAINIAAWRGDYSMVEVLLAQGAEIDDRTKWGEVPLHHAVTFEHIRVCELLLERGADAFAEDKLKRTPYMIAMQKGSDKMKAVFAKYNKAK